MNEKLIELLARLKSAGNAPQRSPNQLAELGMPRPDVDRTPSDFDTFLLDAGAGRGEPQSDEAAKEKMRMIQLNDAAERGDSEEIRRLREIRRAELDKLSNMFNK